MKVLVCEAPSSISVHHANIPQVKKGEVLVKIKYCGICVYDLKRYLGLKNITYPVVLGHEPSGIVEKTGKDVRGIQKGDPAVVDVKVRCGECPACVRGMESRCHHAEASTGFSQYILVPSQNVVKVPKDLDLKTATLTEPLACILHGYRKLNVKTNSSLLVVGDGIMGVLASFVGKAVEKTAVTLLGHNMNRTKAARRLGIQCVITSKSHFPLLGVFDIIICTVEEKTIINHLQRFLHPGGAVLFIGELKDGHYPIDLNTLYSHEYIFVGSKGYDREDFMKALGLIRTFQEQLKPLISQAYPLSELEKGFKDLQKRKILKGILYLDY